jgi:hypothetical protein
MKSGADYTTLSVSSLARNQPKKLLKKIFLSGGGSGTQTSRW